MDKDLPKTSSGSGMPHDMEPRRPPLVRDRRKSHVESGGQEDSEAEPKEAQAHEISELGEARNAAAGYLEDLKRLKAEYENYRKRILREQTDLVERASAHLVSRLLPTLDNLYLAVSSGEATKDFDRMLKGVELVFGELKEILLAEGLELIDARAEKFDPNLHEAAVELPGDDEGELVVVEVLRTGYKFKGRILRPAMVKVVRRGASNTEDKQQDSLGTNEHR